MLAILIQTISHASQRYQTIGDWQFNASQNSLEVQVSEMDNPDYEFLIGIHEAIEAWLCRKAGIMQEQVDEFDMNWKSPALNGVDIYDEPGNDPAALYHKQHIQAGIIERQLALQLGIEWDRYEAALENMWQEEECHE
jgi:hypothetical protein